MRTVYCIILSNVDNVELFRVTLNHPINTRRSPGLHPWLDTNVLAKQLKGRNMIVLLLY